MHALLVALWLLNVPWWLPLAAVYVKRQIRRAQVRPLVEHPREAAGSVTVIRAAAGEMPW